MDCGKKIIAMYGIYLCEKRRQERKRKKRRSVWMQEWLQRRDDLSHINLLQVVELSNPVVYKNFLRMNTETYEELLTLVLPLIQRKDTQMRQAITPNDRLSATLRFLACGQSFEDLKFLTNISPQSLGCIIIETCQAIISSLKDFIKMPRNAEEWKATAAAFENKWNFNHCIGAIDGKHVHIKKPANSGSNYYNYKKRFSIVMMAVVNVNYEFMIVDVGANGRDSDAGVFGQTKFKQMFDENLLNIPQPDYLPFSEEVFPYVFVGDEAFPLLENLMKPYSRNNLTREEQIFNYRLSRARRIVENTFGILANRFRVLLTNISLSPEKAAVITLACCYLHNFLKVKNPSNYLKSSVNCGTSNKQPFENLLNLEPTKSVNAPANAKEIRNRFCNYFNSVGAVPWQNHYV